MRIIDATLLYMHLGGRDDHLRGAPGNGSKQKSHGHNDDTLRQKTKHFF